MTQQLELLTVGQTADELRISERSVYRLMQTGQLPHIKVGARRYMISREQLNKYLADNSVSAAAVS